MASVESDSSLQILDKFYQILLGDLSIAAVEAWIYDCKELEAALAPDDYLTLIGLDYRRPNVHNELHQVVVKYVDLSVLETKRLRRLLCDITERSDAAFSAILTTYDMYCNGLFFLDDLGLRYGLAFYVDLEDCCAPTEEQKSALLSHAYPSIMGEAQKVLGWLDDGKVILTGIDGLGRPGFIDKRGDDASARAAYQCEEQPSSCPKVGFWARIRRTLGGLGGRLG